jgi:hypothetical protein
MNNNITNDNMNVEFLFSTSFTELLVSILSNKVSLEQMLLLELSKRGVDPSTGLWCGFEKSEELCEAWGKSNSKPSTPKTPKSNVAATTDEEELKRLKRNAASKASREKKKATQLSEGANAKPIADIIAPKTIDVADIAKTVVAKLNKKQLAVGRSGGWIALHEIMDPNALLPELEVEDVATNFAVYNEIIEQINLELQK